MATVQFNSIAGDPVVGLSVSITAHDTTTPVIASGVTNGLGLFTSSAMVAGSVYDFTTPSSPGTGTFPAYAAPFVAVAVLPGAIVVPPSAFPVASSLPAPTTSGVTVVPTTSNTNLSSDVSAALTVTNVPTNGNAWGVAYWFRANGTTVWVPYGNLDLAGMPTPAASQTMPTFVYGLLVNGKKYDFAIGYVGVAGYGPVTTIATAVAANSVVITTPYLISTTTTPTIASGATVTSAASVNGLTATLAASFSVTNQPADGSLARLSIWCRQNGTTAWTPQGSIPVPSVGAPPSTQAYTFDICDLTNGVAYDVGCSFQNTQGGEGSITLIGTATAQTIGIPTAYMLGGASVTPVIFSPVATPRAAVTGIATTLNLAWQITNQPTDGSLSRIALYMRKNGDTAWAPYASIPAVGVGANSPPSTGSYTFDFNDLSNGIAYDFGCSFENAQGGESVVAAIVTNQAAQPIAVSTPYLIAGTNPTPTVTTVSLSNSASTNGISAAVTINFTVTNQPTDGSLSRISIWFRANGTTSWTMYTSEGATGLPTPSASQAYSITLSDLTNGQNYDFGCSYENAQGADSSVGTIRTAWTAQVVAIGGTTVTGLTPFTGGTLNSSGGWVNVHAKSSNTSYAVEAGSTFAAKATIANLKLLTGGTDSKLILGTTASGYGMRYDGSDECYITKWISGVETDLYGPFGIGSDTNPHTLALTLVAGSPNQLQATIDSADAGVITDSAIMFTGGLYPVTIYTGDNTGIVTGYAANVSVEHYLYAPSPIKKRIDDTSTLDVSSTPGPVTGALPLPNHDSNVITAKTRTLAAIGPDNVTVTAAVDFARAYANKNIDNVPDTLNLYVSADSLAATILSNMTLAAGGPNGAADAETTGTGSAIGSNLSFSQTVAIVPGVTYYPSWWIDGSQVLHGVGNLQVLDILGNIVSDAPASFAALVPTRYAGAPFTCLKNYANNSDSLSGWTLQNCTAGTDGPNGANDVYQVGTGSAGATFLFSYPVTIVPGQTYSASFWVDQSHFTSGATGGLIGIGDVTGFGLFSSTASVAWGAAAGRYGKNNVAIPANVCPEPYSTWTRTGSAVSNPTAGPGSVQRLQFSTGTGTAQSPLIPVTAGNTVSMSALWAANTFTSGAATVTAYDQTGTAIPGMSISYGTTGYSRRAVSSITIPGGVTGISIKVDANGAGFTGTLTIEAIQVTLNAADPGGYVSTSDPAASLFYEAVGPVIASGQKLKVSQPMMVAATTFPTYYLSSQNPQVTLTALSWSGQPGGFAISNGQKFKISQPMLRNDGVVTPYVSPTTTYARPLATALTSGQVDLSKSGVVNKTLDYVSDGATYASLPLTNIAGTGTSKRALIDFTQAHANKSLDNVPDGATYASLPIANITGTGTSKRALIDLSQAHLNKTQDYVPDGSLRGAVAITELSTGTNKSVKQLNDGTNTRNAAAVANFLDPSGNANGSAPFFANMPNQVVSLADVALQYSTTSTSYAIWLTNLAATTTVDGSGHITAGPPQWIMGDTAQTTYDMGMVSNSGYGASNAGFDSSHPLKSGSGLGAGWKRWYVITWTPSGAHNGTLTTTEYSSEPTQAQKAAAFKDGAFLCVATVAGSSPGGIISGSSGSGGFHGGGGHVPPL